MEHTKSDEAAFDLKSNASISNRSTTLATPLHEVATKNSSGGGTTRRSGGQDE